MSVLTPPDARVSDTRLAPTTLGAGLLMLALTAGYTVKGVSSILDVLSTTGPDSRAVLLGIGPEASATLFVVAAALVLVCCALELYLAIGVLRRRESAREGALFLNGAFALITVPLALAGLLAAERGPAAGWGLLTGVANVAVFALLLHSATRSDVSRAEKRRALSR